LSSVIVAGLARSQAQEEGLSTRGLYNTTLLADTGPTAARGRASSELSFDRRGDITSMNRFAFLLAFLGLTGAAVAVSGGRAEATELDGFWMDSHGEVVLQVEPCGVEMCAKVVWLRLPYGPDRLPLKDFRNPEASLQNRPVCGLRVIEGFKKQPDGTWGGGNVYVPDLGMSFSGYAQKLSPTQIEVRGYVMLPIFGSTEVWSKVLKPAYHCEKDGVPPAPPQKKQ
jgi:uncharacterized protein (DUF2147 family)